MGYDITSCIPGELVFLLSHPCSHAGRRGGLMISALISGSSGPGSIPGRGYCVVFLGKTLYRNRDKLRPDGPLGSHADFFFTHAPQEVITRSVTNSLVEGRGKLL